MPSPAHLRARIRTRSRSSVVRRTENFAIGELYDSMATIRSVAAAPTSLSARRGGGGCRLASASSLSRPTTSYRCHYRGKMGLLLLYVFICVDLFAASANGKWKWRIHFILISLCNINSGRGKTTSLYTLYAKFRQKKPYGSQSRGDMATYWGTVSVSGLMLAGSASGKKNCNLSVFCGNAEK